MPAALCPACRGSVPLPENTTGRTAQTLCPQCGAFLPLPPSASRHQQDHAAAHLTGGKGTAALSARELREELAAAVASSKSLGYLVLALGLIGLLFLVASFCLPTFLKYVGVAIAGGGGLLGLDGIARGLRRRQREVLYVVAGTALCGLAVALILAHQAYTAGADSGGGGTPNYLKQRNQELDTFE